MNQLPDYVMQAVSRQVRRLAEFYIIELCVHILVSLIIISSYRCYLNQTPVINFQNCINFDLVNQNVFSLIIMIVF